MAYQTGSSLTADVSSHVEHSVCLQGSGVSNASCLHRESAMRIVKSLCKKAACADEDTPTEGLRCSPAQRLMSRRLVTLFPVAGRLLVPQVITRALGKLQVKHQTAKLTYDRSAKDLPELNISQPIRMKPLPGAGGAPVLSHQRGGDHISLQ